MYLAPLGARFQWGNALRILVASVIFGAVKAGAGRWRLICCPPREPSLMGFGRKDGIGALIMRGEWLSSIGWSSEPGG